MKRNTVQRDLVLEAVKALRSHATAEEVYRAIPGWPGGRSTAT